MYTMVSVEHDRDRHELRLLYGPLNAVKYMSECPTTSLHAMPCDGSPWNHGGHGWQEIMADVDKTKTFEDLGLTKWCVM